MAVIETQRLELNPVQSSDAEFIYALQNSPKWLKYIGDRNINSVDIARNYIQEKMDSHFKEHGYGNYAVFEKQSNKPVGTCGLFNRPGLDVVDIGFALLPEFEGNGYGSEAAFALLDYAKDELRLLKVSAIVLPENTTSVNLIQRMGLSFVKKVQLPNDEAWLDYYEIVLNE